jgi:putative membrane protein
VQKKHQVWIIVLSIAIPVVVGYLIYRPVAGTSESSWVLALPHVNAAINSLTSILLLVGLYFIKNKMVAYHRLCMLSAFILGCLFLVGYIIYHSNVPSTSFGGVGAIRTVYYSLLITHILLAIVVVPFVLLALFHALKENVDKHKRVVRIAYPVWLYVSISGVLVYLLISPYY